MRVRHSHRGPLKGKANGGVSFNAANPSRGRLTEVCHSTPRTHQGGMLGGAAAGAKTSTVAGASGRVSLRAGERKHSPFIRQRRQKAMPARIRGKSQLSIAREGFLDRRSKRCFWLLLSPQTKVARAGARNSPLRWLRAGRGLYAAARRHLIRPLRGHLPLKGKADGGVSFNTADPSRGRLTEACHSTPRTHQGGRLELVRPGHPSPCDLIRGKAWRGRR